MYNKAGDFMKYIPYMYKKNIFDIPYERLKKENIKCLIFDLDNTLALINEEECPADTMKLIEELKKDFTVLIITNNTKKRVIPYQMVLGIDAIYLAMKPFTVGLRRVLRKYNLKKEEMVMIGDQLVTDIKSGIRFGIKTILVDPLGKKDLKITNFNRFIENRMIKRYSEENLLERGRYYE